MRSRIKPLLILLSLVIIGLSKAVFAGSITISDINPLPSALHTNLIAVGTYLLKAKAGKTIVFANQLPHSMQQVPGIGSDFCLVNNGRTVMPSGGQCNIQLDLTAPSHVGIVNGAIGACVAGVISSCVQYPIMVQIIDLPAAVIDSIDPPNGNRGQSVNISATIWGDFFRSGATVKLQNTGQVINATNVNVVSAFKITCNIPLTPTTTLGAWDVVVTNTDDGQSSTKPGAFTVNPKALVSIAVTPINPSIASGATQQFTATGTYDDTTTADITSLVTWDSDNTSAATIDNVTNKGLATAVAEGTTNITAALSGITSPAQVLTVTPSEKRMVSNTLSTPLTLTFNKFNPVVSTPVYDVYADDKKIYATTGRDLWIQHDNIWEKSFSNDAADITTLCATAPTNPTETVINAFPYAGNYTSKYSVSSWANIKHDKGNENKEELISMYGSSKAHCFGNKSYVTGLFGIFGGKYALSVFDNTNSKFTYKTHNDLKLPPTSNTYGTYVTSDSAKIIVATDSGVSISLDKGNTWTNYSETKKTLGFPSDNVYAVSGNSDGTIFYVGTDKGIIKGIGENGTYVWSVFANESPDEGKLKSSIVYDLYVSADGKHIYAATAAGLSESNDGGTTWITYTKEKNKLASNTVFKVFVRGKEIYAATAVGLSISENEGESWETKTPQQSSIVVKSVRVNKEGKLAIVEPEGLTVFDKSGSSQSFRVSSHHLASDNISKSYVSAGVDTFVIANDNSTSLLGRFDGKQWKFISDKKDYFGLRNMTFVDVAQTQDGESTYLAVCDKATTRCHVIKDTGHELRWQGEFKNVLSMHVTDDGKIYLATDDGIYDVENGAKLSLGTMRFIGIDSIASDELYAVNSVGGVYRGNSQGMWEKITTESFGETYGLSVAKKGDRTYIFVATKNGLFVGSPATTKDVVSPKAGNSKVIWSFVKNTTIIGEVNTVSASADTVYVASCNELYQAGW